MPFLVGFVFEVEVILVALHSNSTIEIQCIHCMGYCCEIKYNISVVSFLADFFMLFCRSGQSKEG